MFTITYFVHGTTTDNEKRISTGWNPGELSALGITQSKELANILRSKASKYDAIISSDLKRAVDSARFMFGEDFKTDVRLRECNYGYLNGGSSEIVEPLYYEHIETPFPNGESMHDVEQRMRALLYDLSQQYDGKHIAFVAHQAPQLALEVIANDKSWKQAIDDDWRLQTPKAWRPGWKYIIK